ncbi:MAG TPA: signal peptide peptidase SppA [Bryobacteraceae bacterium]|jgi:protease-4|nr:signal peptide peptidase SppA [Bryobacteraceae bacterium]
MGKFLIGLVTGIILTGLTLVILAFALVPFREKAPAIADNSVLVLQLEGEIPERPPVDVPLPILGQRGKPTIENIWMTLRKAAADSRIKAVVLEPRALQIGWAKLEEIHTDLENFKKSGKPVYAFLKSAGAREYYLATAATRVYMAPEDPLYLKGMRVEAMYFKKTLDKVGVDVQIAHAGKYKDFGDMFTRTDMSPETKEVLNSVLDDLYGRLVKTIADGRRKSPEQVRALLDQGPFLATQAKQNGLVDELRFEDQMFGELERSLHRGELKKVSIGRYLHVPASSLGLSGKRRIAFLVAEGAITHGGAGDDGQSESGITAEGFNKLLRSVQADSTIDGVVVRIDSPGGEVVASDAIWREMNLLSRKKPLVISMSDTAASGGYYIAMTGDPILSYPGTLTGSIGVVFGKPNLRGLYDKLGITKETLTRGRFADIDSDYRPLNQAELQKLEEGIQASYKEFVTKVAEARHRKYEQIAPVAEGRVWLGSQAQGRGLVDELGGLDRAMELVKQKAKIPQSERVSLVMYPARRSIFDLLLQGQVEDVLESKAGRLWKLWQSRMALEGGLMRLMPFTITVE